MSLTNQMSKTNKMSKTNQMNLPDQLKAAEEAYFATGQPMITDDEYDIIAEAAAREGGAPRPVGARPHAKDACLLPIPMPSLRKVKPGMMRDWEGRQGVISEKLDGISALWVLPDCRLYLRGDQQYGVEKTAFAPLITGLARPEGKWMIRGEIVVAKNNSADRNIINGYLHRTSPDAGVPPAAMRFVAYSLHFMNTPVIARSDQFRMMQVAGFETAWSIQMKVRETGLIELMKQRREQGPYAIDGLVVGEPGVPVPCKATDPYPSDAVAFKMPLADQMAETRVVEIDWNTGRAGVWTPRLRIDPVIIGGARIEWVTGHNAGWIRDRGLGVGARVIVRRSGDVIPIIDSVLVPVAVTGWPQGTWDGVHLVSGKQEDIYSIVHAVELLGVKQCGEERLKKLGVGTLKDLFGVAEGVWASEIGPAIGPKLRAEVWSRAAEASEVIRVLCYPFLPSAVGKKRIQGWAAAGGSLDAPGVRLAGWGADTWAEFCDMIPEIKRWIAESFPAPASVPTPIAAAPKKPMNVASKGVMTLTGFRNPALVAAAEAAGWVVADLSKKTTVLVIKEGYENKKTEKARADGITVWTQEQAFAQL